MHFFRCLFLKLKRDWLWHCRFAAAKTHVAERRVRGRQAARVGMQTPNAPRVVSVERAKLPAKMGPLKSSLYPITRAHMHATEEL